MPSKSSLLYTLFSAATLALAAFVPDTTHDVIIVGGGPAGLSALSGLGRVRRKAVMFDSGEYRNNPTRHMHDVIGNDGTPPAQFRGLARKQISRYDSTSIVDRPIVSITRHIDRNEAPFYEAVDAFGDIYTARKVVLGTGLKDHIPDVPGLREIWGKGAYWCPWCDGWEHRDQPLGMVSSVSDSVDLLLEVHTLYSDIVALTNGTATPEAEAKLDEKSPQWREQLSAWGVVIDDRRIREFHRLQDGSDHKNGDDDREYDIFEVVFEDGSTLVRNAFIVSYPTSQRSSLPTQLGLQMKDGKIDTTTFTGMRTSLPGVFAIGDANSDGSTNVPHAMFSGKRAAVFIHVEMSREESAAAISKRTMPSQRDMEKETERLMGRDIEDLWDQVQRR